MTEKRELQSKHEIVNSGKFGAFFFLVKTAMSQSTFSSQGKKLLELADMSEW